MLRQRIITAVLMLAVLLPALFYPAPWVFSCVALLLIAAAAWEWSRLNSVGKGASLVWALTCAAVCVAAWRLEMLEKPLPNLWIFTGTAWVLLGGLLLRAGPVGWSHLPKTLRLVGGFLALVVAWLAMVQARARGVEFLLSVLLLVWMADIAAYATGRAWGGRFTGGRKLAPSISPGKSWEGVWGGMLGVVLLALVWALMPLHGSQNSLFSQLNLQHGWVFMLIAAVFLVAMSVVGDLVESLVKRSAGAKDSSRLLPGHGGVLDRVDALLPALPLAMMLVSL